MMGMGMVVVVNEEEMLFGVEDELGEKEVFLRLVKLRVRYDVEVVIKLVVYIGMFFFVCGW